MTAMIFAAGLGSRLKPLTDHLPKALVPVASTPMLEHIIRKLKAAGFDKIVINVHHFANQITDFLEQNHNFGITILVSDETDQLLDTGGGLQHAIPLLNELSCQEITYSLSDPMDQKEKNTYSKETENRMAQIPLPKSFLLHNVDILSNCDLKKLAHYHETHRKDAMATLLVSHRKTARYLLFDHNGTLCGWVNKDTMETKPSGFIYREGTYKEYAYSGIQIISSHLLPHLPQGKYSIIDFYLSHCRQMVIQCYAEENLQLIDIGKPATLEKADEFLNQL